MQRRVELSLVLPCFNESGLFLESVSRITDVLDSSRLSYEIVFVDDASRDDTQALIKHTIEADNGRHVFRAVYHDKNAGRGKTVIDGIRAAKGAVVGYIDIDCEVDPVYIPGMAYRILRKKADVVIGRRYYRSTPRAVIREVLSRGYQWLSDRLIGTDRMDTETGYKFFSRVKILPILSKAKTHGWFWDTEIMVYAKRAKLTITEVPVLFLRRFDKVSSVNIIKDTLDYIVRLIAFRKRLSAS